MRHCLTSAAEAATTSVTAAAAAETTAEAATSAAAVTAATCRHAPFSDRHFDLLAHEVLLCKFNTLHVYYVTLTILCSCRTDCNLRKQEINSLNQAKHWL